MSNNTNDTIVVGGLRTKYCLYDKNSSIIFSSNNKRLKPSANIIHQTIVFDLQKYGYDEKSSIDIVFDKVKFCIYSCFFKSMINIQLKYNYMIDKKRNCMYIIIPSESGNPNLKLQINM